jgi:hypothetical protein
VLLDPSKAQPLPAGAVYSFAAKITNNTAQTLWLKSQWPEGNGGWDPPPPPFLVVGDSGRISRNGTWNVEEKVTYTFDEGGTTYTVYIRLNLPQFGQNSVDRSVTPEGTYVINLHGDKSGYHPSVELTVDRVPPRTLYRVEVDAAALVGGVDVPATILPPAHQVTYPVNLVRLRVENDNDRIAMFNLSDAGQGHNYVLTAFKEREFNFEWRPAQGYTVTNIGDVNLRLRAWFASGPLPER